MDYKIFLYIILGILPSLVWLSFYLKKDSNPEPKGMILKIFLWGALVTIPVFFVQISLAMLLTKINVNPLISSLIYWFLIISFTEEIFKFLVVKFKVLNSHHLDEPVDVVIYMIVAALGFAGLENILYLFSPIEQSSFNVVMGNALLITFIRFIGATFLHTLCSAVVGYALAISFCDQKNRFLEVSTGIILAILLHGVYNFSIITLDGYLKIVIPAVVILTLAVLVFSGFEKLKKIKSVTILN